MYLSFSVHKLSKFLSNPGKVNSEGLVHLSIYIRDNKILVLKYSADMKDAHLSELLVQASNNTENQLVVFFDSR